jgi:ketosteroid isomerase-like protein
MRFEPGVGGRLLLDGTREVGRISVWEPGPRLAFSYGPPGSAERTEVDVRFETTNEGTRVVLTHRGLAGSDGHWANVLAGFAKHSLEKALLNRLGQFLDAINAADLDFFERNLTEDAVLIFPGPNNVYTKQQCIESMRDHPPYLKYDIDDTRIVHMGETTAVITHAATVQNAGHANPYTVMVSTVLIKTKGTWQMALHQWTPTDEQE